MTRAIAGKDTTANGIGDTDGKSRPMSISLDFVLQDNRTRYLVWARTPVLDINFDIPRSNVMHHGVEIALCALSTINVTLC